MTFTGSTHEWSDSEEPAQVGTCDLPVMKWQVLGLPFSTAIFRTLPIRVSHLSVGKVSLKICQRLSGQGAIITSVPIRLFLNEHLIRLCMTIQRSDRI